MEILWSALIVGLAGSLHCVGMCGPLSVAMLPAGKLNAAFFARRTVYHLARVSVYVFMGVLFGLVGNGFSLVGGQQLVSIVFGVLLLLVLITGFSMESWLVRKTMMGRAYQQLKAQLSKMIARKGWYATVGMGLLNGLLPCGLVWLALLGAMASGTWYGGGLYMGLFGLGTLPLLLVFTFAGGWLSRRYRFNFNRVLPWVMGVFAILLILRGLGLGIPFISPDPGVNPGSADCHTITASAG